MLRKLDGLTRVCGLSAGLILIASSIPGWAQAPSGQPAPTPQTAPQPAGKPPTAKGQMGKGHMALDKMDDATFVRMMIQHHEGGIEMARIEEQRGSSAELKTLARRLRETQERELAELRKHASQQATGTAGSGAAKAAPAAMEAHAGQMMEKLKAAEGAELDRQFVDHMGMHLQMTVQMVEHTTFKDEQLQALAQQMRDARKKESAELEKHKGAQKSAQ